MDSCCLLGKQINEKNKILYKTDNFTVTPALGQIGIEGYLLICSNKHYVSIGGMPSELDKELEEVLSKTREVINQNYSDKIVSFEHGPKLGCYKGGSCLEHAHLHVVPTDANILDFLDKFFELEEIFNFDRLRQIYSQADSSYLFVESQDEKRHICKVKIPIPSQYLRQIIAVAEKRENWDWRIYPDVETFEKTLAQLRNKF